MRPIRIALTAVSTVALMWAPSAALAQTTPDPTAGLPEPIKEWTVLQAFLWAGVGALLVLGLVGAYLRYAPTFYGTDKKPERDRRTLPPGARTAAALAMQTPQELAASPQPPPAPARQAATAGPSPAAAAQATQTAAPKPEPQQQEVAEKPAEEVKAKEEEQSTPPQSEEGPEAAAPSEAEAAEKDEQPAVEQEKPGGEQQPDARGPENIVDTEAPADGATNEAQDEAPAETAANEDEDGPGEGGGSTS